MTESQRLLFAVALTVIYVIWVAILLWRHYRPKLSKTAIDQSTFLIAYASQSGNARALAEQYANDKAGEYPVLLTRLSDLSLSELTHIKRALFVVSTYGHGEPPDNGRSFYRSLQNPKNASLSLQNLTFDVVALGDSHYPHFCAFGEQLYQLLEKHGATAGAALTRLDHAKGETGKSAVFFATGTSNNFILDNRTQLNKTSETPLFELSFFSDRMSWEAGDILDILPANSELEVTRWLHNHNISPDLEFDFENQAWTAKRWLTYRQLNSPQTDTSPVASLTALPLNATRSYTIASIPEEKQLKLIVRQHKLDNGKLGLGSGWLTHYVTVAEQVKGKIKPNPACHIPALTSPLLLIGAGSGLAGIRAQLSKFTQPALAIKPSRIWLLYGERYPDKDDVLEQTLDTPIKSSTIRVDKVFSRCPNQPQYVQDKLVQSAKDVKALVDAGGQIYVCGSYEGMGEGVHGALLAILGEEKVQFLIDTQRYHRDIY
ncbi:flavodoxin domain-containing protein [Alteromonas sp. 14N.309.X.WAT.G.H12]|uniref:flavodoxin domain-containing protein n=1 Tax=Alteromonas sp. 14N.309.X.WAT.G.H12 TaxID=3120824 RepID=UPI002FD40221